MALPMTMACAPSSMAASGVVRLPDASLDDHGKWRHLRDDLLDHLEIRSVLIDLTALPRVGIPD